MSFSAPLAVERNARKGIRSIWTCATATGAFIAAGAVFALSTLAPVPTPGNVAKAFLEARFAHDSPTTWALMCATTRSEIGDYAEFVRGVESLARHDDQSRDADFDIDIDYLHGTSGPSGSSLRLAAMLTGVDLSGAYWQGSVELVVVEDAGEFRVCDKGGYLW